MLAPGDGAAEPGGHRAKENGACEAGDRVTHATTRALISSLFVGRSASVTHFVGWSIFGIVPQARLGHRLGLTFWPPASQAGRLISTSDTLVESVAATQLSDTADFFLLR